MVVRNVFDRGPRVRLSFPKDSGRTRQEMMEECDINNIMSKYHKTGAIDHFSRHSGSYGDVNALDYHSAMNVMVQADQMFHDLPAKLRAELGNDPAAFLEFVSDESNLEALELHGLLKDGNSVTIAREAAETAAAAVLAASVVVPEPPVVAPRYTDRTAT